MRGLITWLFGSEHEAQRQTTSKLLPIILGLLIAGGTAESAPSATQAPFGSTFIFNPVRVSKATGLHPVRPFVSPHTLKKARKSRMLLKAASSVKPKSAMMQALLASQKPSGCAGASGYPAPIIALASALKCDPDLIFEYVYNNIEYEPLYGSNKGALGTLLDGRGDDADQAILLVTLWNAAGYSQTGYFNNPVNLTGAQIANWLGVPNDCLSIVGVLNTGGITFTNQLPASCSAGQALTSITVNHFFAALQLSGTWYYFDPSFKLHTLIAATPNLATILGYNRTTFLADVGGTISGGPNSNSIISNVSRTNLRTDLTTYANNLVSYINSTNRTLTVGNIIGGKTIVPLTGSPIRIQQPTWTPTATFPVN